MNQYFSLRSSHFHGGTLVFTVAQSMRDTFGLHSYRGHPNLIEHSLTVNRLCHFCMFLQYYWEILQMMIFDDGSDNIVTEAFSENLVVIAEF